MPAEKIEVEVDVERGGGGSKRGISSTLSDVVEAVVISNVKAIGEQPANLANLSLGNLIQNTNLSQQNTVSNQQSINEIGVALTGRVTNTLSTMGPLEAMSAVNVFTGNTLAQDIAGLKATVNAFG